MCPNCENRSFLKSFYVFIFIGVILISLVSLASESKSRVKLNEKIKEELVAVLEANENLHNAFFEYNANQVQKAAKNLSGEISKISDAEISKLLNFSKGKLLEITASADREENNKNYHLVSMALIHIVNKYDVGMKYNAYSCPMVKKKWVQNSEKMDKVHNPYAPEMPHCGSKDSHY